MFHVCETLGLALRGEQEGAGIEYCTVELRLSHVNGTDGWSNKAEIRGVQRRNKIKIEWKCSKPTNLICNIYIFFLQHKYSGMRCRGWSGREGHVPVCMRAQHNPVNSMFRHDGYLRPGYRLGKSGRESRQGQSVFSFPKSPQIYWGHSCSVGTAFHSRR